MKLLVLIVTYNRLNLLKKCLESLRQQTYKNFDILVINNHSTDDTSIYLTKLKNREKSLKYINLPSNIGGAGGFYIGIKESMKLNYTHVWLMDDDVLPENTALENLIFAEQYVGDYGFLVSLPLWKDGSICQMNKPLIKKVKQENKAFIQHGLSPVQKATFVSLFLKTNVIKHVGFPIKEFFIWADDQEFTERISKRYPCYLVHSSVIRHITDNNIGSDISRDNPGRIERYYYAYRNEFYISRKKGILSLSYYFVRTFFTLVKILIYSRSQKRKRIKYLFKGLKDGFFFNPQIEYWDD